MPKESQPVKVWSSVGATLPIGDTYANIKFSFGHERFAKNDSEEELLKVINRIDDFNEKVLDKRLNKYGRVIREFLSDVEDSDEDMSRKKKARKKLGRK